ncbi:MAG: phosphotransferase [Candidatus Sericytochromatia bacterium]|nr:phosphotransferase [Candidatus Sericytochromatia bacterium]
MSGVAARPAVDETRLKAALTAYPHLGAFVRILRNGLSVNTAACLIETVAGRYFVKCHDLVGDAASVIGSEHALVTHLVDRGFPTPVMHRNGDGQTLTTRDHFGFAVSDVAAGEDRYGETPVFAPYGRLTEVASVGACLATLHAAWADLPPPPHPQDQGMTASYDLLTGPDVVSGLDALVDRWPVLASRLGDAAIRQRLITYLAPRHADLLPLWPDLRRGLIHGDFIKRNLFWDGDSITAVIDFSLWNTAPRVFDLALAALPCGFDWPALLGGQRGLRPDDLRILVMAYDACGTLHDSERAALPIVMETARIEFYLSIVAAAMDRGDEVTAERFWRLLWGVLDWFTGHPDWRATVR